MKNRYWQHVVAALMLFPLLGCGDNSVFHAEAATDATAEADANQVVDPVVAEAEAASAAAKAATEAEPTASSSTPIPTGGSPTNPQAENTIKSFINLNGQLCAHILEVHPIALPDTAEVTCIEHRGGTSTVTYLINIKTGALQKTG